MLETIQKTKSASQIAGYLREQVKRCSPGEKIGTEVGLSKVCGMSRETVRRAVEKLMKDGLVERKVGKGIYATGGVKKIKLVEFLIPTVADHWYAPALVSAQESCNNQGVDMMIRNGNVDLAYELDLVNELPSSAADGAIIVSIGNKSFSNALMKLKFSNYPFVVLDEEFPNSNIDWIVTDFYKMGYQSSQKFLKLGHKKIACMGSLEVGGHGSAITRGIIDAVNDAGFPCDRTLFADIPAKSYLDNDKDAYIQELRKLMQRSDRPTAIVMVRERYAWRICNELQSMGFKIPEDVSIVGFGHDNDDSRSPLKISSFVTEARKMGQIAVEMLLGQTGQQDAEDGGKGILVEANWLEGQSIGPAPVRPRG